MARIEYCDTSKSNERTREILGKNRNANIFRMMAHSPSHFEQYCRLGGAIRHKGELDPVVRELAITRTGILCQAPYEIVAHKRIGKNVGVTDEQNEALENWQSAKCFTQPLRLQAALTLPRVYIHCTRFADKKPFAQFDTATKGKPSWRNFDLDASHSPNVTAPAALVDVLQRSLEG